MRILIRTAAFVLLIGVSYGIATLLPEDRAEIAGLVTFVLVTAGAFAWARSDGRRVPRTDGLRDWLVVAAVVAVFWWVSLAVFEGSDDIVDYVRLNFLSVLSTAGVMFVSAFVGLTLGRGSRGG